MLICQIKEDRKFLQMKNLMVKMLCLLMKVMVTHPKKMAITTHSSIQARVECSTGLISGITVSGSNYHAQKYIMQGCSREERIGGNPSGPDRIHDMCLQLASYSYIATYNQGLICASVQVHIIMKSLLLLCMQSHSFCYIFLFTVAVCYPL